MTSTGAMVRYIEDCVQRSRKINPQHLLRLITPVWEEGYQEGMRRVQREMRCALGIPEDGEG